MIQHKAVVSDGIFIELVQVIDGEPQFYSLKDNELLVDDLSCMNMVKPFWDGTKWIDNLTQEDIDTQLKNAKKSKINELRSECEKAILGYFKATVDNAEYSFSNDGEAQSNFKDGLWALEGNRATTVKWTAYDINGNVVRLDLNLAQLSDVNVARITHKNDQVAKFRDVLEPQVWAVTITTTLADALAELDAIVW